MIVCFAALPGMAVEKEMMLRLFLPETTICSGTTVLVVELDLRNTGSVNHDVEVSSLGSGFDAIALYSTVSNGARFETLQITGDRMERPKVSSVTLQPGASHAVRGAIVLDPSFFSEPGFYKIRTEYYQRRATQTVAETSVHLVSNWAIVQVEPCAKNAQPPARRLP
jgi:hypothetical protein